LFDPDEAYDVARRLANEIAPRAENAGSMEVLQVGKEFFLKDEGQ